VSELTDRTEASEAGGSTGTVGGALARWVRAVPPPLAILLTLTAAAGGLHVSEHSLLYAPLGFPDEVGHSLLHLAAQPVLILFTGVAVSAWIMLRRLSEAAWQPGLERVLAGALAVMLVYAWVLAPAEATTAQAAIRAGKPFHSPPLAPLAVNASLAEVEWRADVPTSARVGHGPVLYVGWVAAGGGVWWFWDPDRRVAVGVPGVQVALVRTKPSGAESSRFDTETPAPPGRRD
jgi:hypothetical protein